jgi:hypothetical protein
MKYIIILIIGLLALNFGTAGAQTLSENDAWIRASLMVDKVPTVRFTTPRAKGMAEVLYLLAEKARPLPDFPINTLAEPDRSYFVQLLTAINALRDNPPTWAEIFETYSKKHDPTANPPTAPVMFNPNEVQFGKSAFGTRGAYPGTLQYIQSSQSE